MKIPGQDSNLDKESQNALVPRLKSFDTNSLGQTGDQLSALLAHPAPSDPGFARLIESWPKVPEHIKAAIQTLVATAYSP